MDHLPKTLALRAEVVVPVLTAEFDFDYPTKAQGYEGFERFPEAHGFAMEELAATAVQSRRSAAFLQSWLFFGLLRELFARPDYCYDPKDFVRISDEGAAIINTEALTKYAWFWQAGRTHDYGNSMRELEATVDRCLNYTNQVMTLVTDGMSPSDRAPSEWTINERVIFSLALLGDYLSSLRVSLSLYTPGLERRWDFPLWDHAMSKAGWCPGEIAVLKGQKLSIRCFLAWIDRSDMGKDHSRCSSWAGCLADQLDEETYQTAHQRQCSRKGCEQIGPELDPVLSALRKGGWPLVDASKVAEDSPPRISETGTAPSTQTRYVAISHVWSDGLGNPRRNCLNLCQLRHIQKLVDSLYPEDERPVPFWLDSLCIPVDDACVKERKAAIVRMNQTFSQADKVIVLDNSLQFLDEKAFPLVEILMRLKYAPWMARMWTLLEGNISRRLYFQFGSGVTLAEAFMDPTTRQGSITVSDLLEKIPDEKLVSCPSAIYLARALASPEPGPMAAYAELPEQEDEDMEELRQMAIANLEANKYNYAVAEKWRLALTRIIDMPYEPSEEDTDVKVSVDIIKTCPVVSHAFGFVSNLRVSNPETQADDAPIVTGYHFGAVSRAMAARTTSRLDDETVCLGAILGVDLNDIVSVPTMKWKRRKWLDSWDSQRSMSQWTRRLGINTRQYTAESHEKRMETLLGKVDRFSSSMVFNNHARLKAHSWAPRSTLDSFPLSMPLWTSGKPRINTWAADSAKDANAPVELPGAPGVAVLDKYLGGLRFKASAYMLGPDQELTQAREPATPSAFRGIIAAVLESTGFLGRLVLRLLTPWKQTAAPDVLVIRPSKMPSWEYAKTWLRVEFLSQDRTITSVWEGQRTWADYIRLAGCYAVMYPDQGDVGSLVRVVGTGEDGTTLLEHVRLVQKARTEEEEGVTVDAAWLHRKECVMR